MPQHVCGNRPFGPGQMADTSDKEDKNLLPKWEMQSHLPFQHMKTSFTKSAWLMTFQRTMEHKKWRDQEFGSLCSPHNHEVPRPYLKNFQRCDSVPFQKNSICLGAVLPLGNVILSFNSSQCLGLSLYPEDGECHLPEVCVSSSLIQPGTSQSNHLSFGTDLPFLPPSNQEKLSPVSAGIQMYVLAYGFPFKFILNKKIKQI